MATFREPEFMTAEKRKVLKQWEAFLKGGCQQQGFTKRLYEHLHLHCSFIAHFDREGFYSTYFERGEDTARFLKQFDAREAGADGVPPGVESSDTCWMKGDFEDLSRAMIEVGRKYIPNLVELAKQKQRAADIAAAEILLAKHNIKPLKA